MGLFAVNPRIYLVLLLLFVLALLRRLWKQWRVRRAVARARRRAERLP